MRSKLQTSRSGESKRECQILSRLVLDLKWEIISRKPPMQGLKSRMCYLPWVVMLTLLVLLNEYTTNSPAEYSCIHTSINQHPYPSGLPHSFFLRRIKDAFFTPSKIKNSRKFLEATSQRNRLSRKPLCHISISWLIIAFDDQFWVTTLPYHKQVWGSYCPQLTVLVTWCMV